MPIGKTATSNRTKNKKTCKNCFWCDFEEEYCFSSDKHSAYVCYNIESAYHLEDVDPERDICTEWEGSK